MLSLKYRRIRQFINHILLFCLLGIAGSTYANSNNPSKPAANDAWHQWPVMGQADLRWFIFDVYTSILRSEAGQYDSKRSPVSQNIALQIIYQRSISAQDLLKATQQQWQHLGYEVRLINHWMKTLARIFPSVQAGDMLTFVIKQQQGYFYYQKQSQSRWIPLGVLEDRSLADAFMSIWLSPQTEYPRMRQQLLGASS
jgi:hypothetical protein